MIVVCDATSLILLAKLSDLHLLKALYKKVYIPKEIYNDVVIKGKGKSGEKEVKKAKGDWIEIKDVSDQIGIKKLQDIYGLGEGEAAAIILARDIKANFLLTDDRLARKFALSHFQDTPIMVSGTIGVLKFAREKGLITKSQFKSKIEFLKQEGFYLKENLYQQILKETEENQIL